MHIHWLILQSLSRIEGVQGVNENIPVNCDDQRHKGTTILGQWLLTGLHQRAGHLIHIHPLCAHYSALTHNELGKIPSVEVDPVIQHCETRFSGNTSHSVVPKQTLSHLPV